MSEAEEEPSPPEVQPRARSGIFGYAALAVALVFAIGIGVYIFTSGGDETEGSPPQLSAQVGTPEPDTGPLDPNRPAEGEVAPDFALRDARDPSKLVKLSDFRGTPVVLNFYYSTCAPCKDEVPTFARAEDRLGDSVVFLGVDYLESAEDAVSILDEYGASYPAVLDRSGAVAEHYRANGFPKTLFIDADGVVRAIRSGEVKEEALPGYLAKIGLE